MALPAFTSTTMRRGRLMASTNAGTPAAGTSPPPFAPKTPKGCSATKRSVTSVVRL